MTIQFFDEDKIRELNEDHLVQLTGVCLCQLAENGRTGWKKLYHLLKSNDDFSEQLDEIMEQVRSLVDQYDADGTPE